MLSAAKGSAINLPSVTSGVYPPACKPALVSPLN